GSVRPLSRAADAHPAGDVAGRDVGCPNLRDRRAHAVARAGRLVPRVRVAVLPGDVGTAHASFGIRLARSADENREGERAHEEREESPQAHSVLVGYGFGPADPPKGPCPLPRSATGCGVRASQTSGRYACAASVSELAIWPPRIFLRPQDAR